MSHRSMSPCWSSRTAWLALAAVAALSACGSVPLPVEPMRPTVPARFKGEAAAATVAGAPNTQPAAISTSASDDAASSTPWRVFADPLLESLQARALAANPNLEVAAARLQQARATLRQTEAAGRLQLGLNAGATRQGGPLVNAAGTQGSLLTAGLSLAFEADFFGRQHTAREAAALDSRSREAALQAARLLVQADVAQTHFELRALAQEHALLRDAEQLQQQALDLAEQRWQRGAWSEAAVLPFRADAAAARAATAALQTRRVALENALATLLGEPASGFVWPGAAPPVAKAGKADKAEKSVVTSTAAASATANTSATTTTTTATATASSAVNDWPTVPVIPAGLPSTLLARRPDIAAAQQAEAAARARSGLARSTQWPSFALTASGGHASASLLDLVQAGSRAWGLGLLGALPLLDGGRRAAAIDAADAVLQAETAQRQALVLQAFQEVEDQLGALASLAQQAAQHAVAVQAMTRARELAESRFRQGLNSRFEVLAAHRADNRVRWQALQVQAARQRATVGLIKALGGSWAADASADALAGASADALAAAPS